MGFGFEERNDAFDFNATIQDFRSKPPPSTFKSFSEKVPIVVRTANVDPLVPSPPSGKSRVNKVDDFADFGEFQAAATSEVATAAPAQSSSESFNLLDL